MEALGQKNGGSVVGEGGGARGVVSPCCVMILVCHDTKSRHKDQ